MSPRAFRPLDPGSDLPTRVVEILQGGDCCNECLPALLGRSSPQTRQNAIRAASKGFIAHGGQILTHPFVVACPRCKAPRRTVFTLAVPAVIPPANRGNSPEIMTFAQNLHSFLGLLEKHPDPSDDSRQVTVFAPLFVGTDWRTWEVLDRSIRQRKIVRFRYGKGEVTAAPMHLWWAQGSWYLMAHRLKSSSDGRVWHKEHNGMRSGLKMARIQDLEVDYDIPYPDGLPDPRAWLGTGDWLFRGDASENGTAVVVLGSRLLHYFRERLESGLESDLRLWEFGAVDTPDWVHAILPPTMVRDMATGARTLNETYREVTNPDADPETGKLLDNDYPAALLAFPFPSSALDDQQRHVGVFEAARRILSWGGEAVVVSPPALATRVRELARIILERQGRIG